MQLLGLFWGFSMLLLWQGQGPQAKGYAFYRPVLGGARPERIVEEGAAAPLSAPEKARAQYYLYIISPDAISTRDTAALWMEGKRVSYQFERVSMPVIQSSSMFPGQFDTVIHQKSGYAYQLVLNSIGFRMTAEDAKPSMIEWHYRKKGRHFRCSFSPWKALSPIALQ